MVRKQTIFEENLERIYQNVFNIVRKVREEKSTGICERTLKGVKERDDVKDVRSRLENILKQGTESLNEAVGIIKDFYEKQIGMVSYDFRVFDIVEAFCPHCFETVSKHMIPKDADLEHVILNASNQKYSFNKAKMSEGKVYCTHYSSTPKKPCEIKHIATHIEIKRVAEDNYKRKVVNNLLAKLKRTKKKNKIKSMIVESLKKRGFSIGEFRTEENIIYSAIEKYLIDSVNLEDLILFNTKDFGNKDKDYKTFMKELKRAIRSLHPDSSVILPEVVIEYRTKNPSSIADKAIERKYIGAKKKGRKKEPYPYDLFGMRIIIYPDGKSVGKDIRDVERKVDEALKIKGLREKDYTKEKGDDDAYRALHAYGHLFGKTLCEILISAVEWDKINEEGSEGNTAIKRFEVKKTRIEGISSLIVNAKLSKYEYQFIHYMLNPTIKDISELENVSVLGYMKSRLFI